MYAGAHFIRLILERNMFFKKRELEILAPFAGKIKRIEEVSDSIFGGGKPGKGIAIIPEENEIYSPVSGVITSLFPTLHAIGITTKEGLELLIHIGINTVNLGGVGFEAKIQEKAGVKVGNLLLIADINGIKRAGYSTATPIVVCNPNEFKEIICTEEASVKRGDVIMRVKL